MKDTIEKIFEDLKDTWDTELPTPGHEQRFAQKLKGCNGVVTTNRETAVKRQSPRWIRTLPFAASVALLLGLLFLQMNRTDNVATQIAKISPEVGNTHFYFASLIEQQVKQLESEQAPETEKIISDTVYQLKQLETDYEKLEHALINGGDGKLILSAMITNFQTRIDLLNDVLDQIETIKKLKNTNHENLTI